MRRSAGRSGGEGDRVPSVGRFLRRPAPRAVLLTAGGLVALAVVASALLVLFENRLVYYPDPVIHRTPASAGLAYRDVRFLSAGAVVLDGWYVPAPSPRAVVIVCHGDAGNISTRIALLRGLHALGLSTFLFDYRGYGRSAGHPTEGGTYLDADAAWRWVARHVPGVASGALPVVIMGRSLGGPIAAQLAASHPPAALVLDSTFPSLRSLVHQLVPFLPLGLLLRYRYDTLAFLKHVHCPVLVVHSRNDRIVPFAQGRELYAAIHSPKLFLEVRGPHARGFSADLGRYERGLERFLERYVFAPPPRPGAG